MESGPLRAVHSSRHKWPRGLVNSEVDRPKWTTLSFYSPSVSLVIPLVRMQGYLAHKTTHPPATLQ